MKRKFNWIAGGAWQNYLWCVSLAFMGLSGCTQVEQAFFDSEGTQIHYTVQGNGEPLILLHGSTATGWANWSFPGTADLLDDEFQVIIPDHRGHGRSDKPLDPDEYGIEMVKDVDRLMGHLGIDSAHIAGYSMGGFIGLKLAVAFPDRVRSLALGGAGWHSFRERPPLTPDQVPFPPLHENYSFDALVAMRSSWAELRVTEAELRTVTQPLLAVIGSEDPILDNVLDLLNILPETEMVIVDGQNHTTTVFSPELKNALLEFFVLQRDAANVVSKPGFAVTSSQL